MNNKKNTAVHLAHGAMIAAAYAAATYLSAGLGLAYGPVQLRISEALTVLPVFTPAAVPGLTLGCLIGNLSSPYGIWDVILGTAATLLAAIFSRRLRKIRIKGLPLLSMLMPVVFNAVIIGAEVTVYLSHGAGFTGFIASAGEIALGEACACIALGIPVYYAIRRSGIFGKSIK